MSTHGRRSFTRPLSLKFSHIRKCNTKYVLYTIRYISDILSCSYGAQRAASTSASAEQAWYPRARSVFLVAARFFSTGPSSPTPQFDRILTHLDIFVLRPACLARSSSRFGAADVAG